MKPVTKTMLMALAILMTTGLALQSTRAATKTELAAAQQKRSAEALAKMTINEVAPTTAAIAGMKTVKSKEWTVPTLAMKMQRIPAGTFKMGSPASEMLRQDSETQHDVTISKPFYMGVYEVTQAQFYKLMLPADFDHAGWTFYRGPFWKGTAVHYRRMPNGEFNQAVGAELLPDHPMECVTWKRAMDFCKKLTAIESGAGRLPAGYEYRLPTEAEWEYACRAGTDTPFNIVEADFDKIQKTYETEKDEGKYKGVLSFAYVNEPNPRFSHTDMVGGNRKPNAWGLCDMHGNVYEWCLDTMKPYSADAKTDPVVLVASGDKVIRGGSIGSPPRFLRSAARYAVPRDVDYFGMLGLRMVLAPMIDAPMPEDHQATRAARQLLFPCSACEA